jgi:hypothetical protein
MSVASVLTSSDCMCLLKGCVKDAAAPCDMCTGHDGCGKMRPALPYPSPSITFKLPSGSPSGPYTTCSPCSTCCLAVLTTRAAYSSVQMLTPRLCGGCMLLRRWWQRMPIATFCNQLQGWEQPLQVQLVYPTCWGGAHGMRCLQW